MIVVTKIPAYFQKNPVLMLTVSSPFQGLPFLTAQRSPRGLRSHPLTFHENSNESNPEVKKLFEKKYSLTQQYSIYNLQKKRQKTYSAEHLTNSISARTRLSNT